MCRRVNCSKCGRPTYAGCGAHIEQVLGDVPREARCQCREQKSQTPASGAATGSWMQRLLKR
jgi:hypothetical protein